MYVLPFAFIFVIARFPAGLVLYWMTTNLWTVGQGLITRRLIPKVGPPGGGGGGGGPKRSSRTPPKDSPDGGVPAEPPEPKPSGQPRQVRRKKKARR